MPGEEIHVLVSAYRRPALLGRLAVILNLYEVTRMSYEVAADGVWAYATVTVRGTRQQGIRIASRLQRLTDVATASVRDTPEASCKRNCGAPCWSPCQLGALDQVQRPEEH